MASASQGSSLSKALPYERAQRTKMRCRLDSQTKSHKPTWIHQFSNWQAWSWTWSLIWPWKKIRLVDGPNHTHTSQHQIPEIPAITLGNKMSIPSLMTMRSVLSWTNADVAPKWMIGPADGAANEKTWMWAMTSWRRFFSSSAASL